MTTLVIGNKSYSSWSLRPWLVLTQAGVPFEEEVVPLDQPETRSRILARSPSGRVPVLYDGDVVVWDSLAIAEYVAERHPDRQLWPADVAARAYCRAVSAEMHAGFAALREHLPMNLRRTGRPRADSIPPAVASDIARIKAIWRECRARFGRGGELLFGGFTIADAMYAPVVTRFGSYGVPLDGDERRYADAIEALPAMRAWREGAAAEEWVLSPTPD
jgi:glutathione S-transferase